MREEQQEIAFLITLVIGSSCAAWFLPDKYHFHTAFAILVLGLWFDIASLFYGVMTIITGKFMSGFPGISLFIYAWFILASKFSLVALSETSLRKIILLKLVDAGLLFVFSFLCHLPARFYKPR